MRLEGLKSSVLECNRLEGISSPRACDVLIEQEKAESELLTSYKAGLKHRNWILSGPEGIGKATLAFRFANFILAHPDSTSQKVQHAKNLSLAENNSVQERTDSIVHPDIMYIAKTYDEKSNRFKTEITVEDVRRSIGFIGKTSAKPGGWRVVIIDTADDLNTNSSNALLRALDSQQHRVVFLVIAHNHHKLLRTLCSRCRIIRLLPLTESGLQLGLRKLGIAQKYTPEQVRVATKSSKGSLRQAVLLLSSNGIAIKDEVASLVRTAQQLDISRANALAGQIIAKQSNNAVFHMFCDLIICEITERARETAISGNITQSIIWANTYSQLEKLFHEAKIYNMDKHITIMAAFSLISTNVRNAPPINNVRHASPITCEDLV